MICDFLYVYLFSLLNWSILVGGIYTVIRSKVPVTKREFGDNYIAVGPLNEAMIRTEVEIREPDIGALRDTINSMRAAGIGVVFGNWLIEGYPQVVLFDMKSALWRLDQWKKELWEASHIGSNWITNLFFSSKNFKIPQFIWFYIY